MTETPPLIGLVLAGGRSRRMGFDKGLIEIAGASQTVRALRLLEPFVTAVYVSIRAAQAAEGVYAGLPQVIDDGSLAGPAAGLAAAWREHGGTALLVLAVDMPRIDAATLERLVAARDPAALATAFVHADGTPEPLCTIWEPAACSALVEAAGLAGGVSLRRLLEVGPAALIEPPEAARLESANGPEAQLRMARELDSP